MASGRLLVFGLLGWHTIASVGTHPDYLAYFNELAGDTPERILVDSDLDWGQDLGRLADTVHARGIEHLRLAYFGTADPARHGLAGSEPLVLSAPPPGWAAVSVTLTKLGSHAGSPRRLRLA